MATVSKDAQNAAALIDREFMTVGEMQKLMKLSRYQYARQLIKDNRYGLGENTIEIGTRVFVSRAAVEQAIKTRAERAKADAAKEKAKTAA